MGRLQNANFANRIVSLPMTDTSDTSEGDVTLDDGELKMRGVGGSFHGVGTHTL